MRRAASGSVAPYIASSARTEARWCAAGQTPQTCAVSCGISSAARPRQNRSNPRSSGTCRNALSTFPASSRSTSILPCPSRRVMGSMVIRRVTRPPAARAARARAASAAAYEYRQNVPAGSGSAAASARTSSSPPGEERRERGEHRGAAVAHAVERAEAAAARHPDLDAPRLAALARGGAEADEPLGEEAAAPDPAPSWRGAAARAPRSAPAASPSAGSSRRAPAFGASTRAARRRRRRRGARRRRRRSRAATAGSRGWCDRPGRRRRAAARGRGARAATGRGPRGRRGRPAAAPPGSRRTARRR